MKQAKSLAIVTSFALLGLAGCSTIGTSSDEVAELQKQLEDKDKETASLEATVKELEKQVATGVVETTQVQRIESDETPMLPPSAKPGECYARVFVPPTYRNTTEQALKKGASEGVKVIPARYELVESKVLVKESSEEARLIPAKYEWVEEKILVKEESEKLVDVPAVYENITEEVLVKPAYTTWKKGRGPIEKVDNATGEIMCLVEVPAEYKTLTKRVMKTPPSTKKVTLPAEYKTVKKQVMVEPPKMVKTTVPAEYNTVKVRKVVEPAKEERITFPAEYQTVSKREIVTEGYMQWRPILCETNARPDLISQVQRALLAADYNPGPLDGILGNATMDAVNSFQRSNRLATGQLTIETIEALGINLK